MSPATIDFVLAAILVVFAFKGFATGFIRSLVSIAAVFGAWFFTAAFPAFTAPVLAYMTPPGDPAFALVARITTWIVAFVAVQAAGFLITGLLENMGLSGADKLAGLALGALTGVVIGCLPLFFVSAIPQLYHWQPVQETIRDSFFLSAYTPVVRTFVPAPARPRRKL